MTPAFEHALDLFKRLALADELVGYPSQLFVVPVDAEELSKQVIEQLDGGTTAVVVFADASIACVGGSPCGWRRAPRKAGVGLGVLRARVPRSSAR